MTYNSLLILFQYASATVTYMVVLLQFDLGQQRDKCDKNIVHNCTI
jgi:hypothetical protein